MSDETTGVWDEPADRTIRRLEAENERLQAIVDKLPVTADGVPVVPGMDLWVRDPSRGGVYQWMITAVCTDGRLAGFFHGAREAWNASDCYSTREAAEAAANDGHDNGQ